MDNLLDKSTMARFELGSRGRPHIKPTLYHMWSINTKSYMIITECNIIPKFIVIKWGQVLVFIRKDRGKVTRDRKKIKIIVASYLQLEMIQQ